MDTTLIKNWNAKVGKHDSVIFLGDFCYKGRLSPENYIDRLNGYITFIRGNHDNNNSLNTHIESLDIYMARKLIHCVHDPFEALPRYEINLVGHVHQNWKIDVWEDSNNLKVNVGVDVWNFSPININDILKAVQKFR
jgi:calcineurin-like phosphoesterase family protein